MKLVPTSISRNIARTILTTKKNSPHIFFASGVIGMIGSTVLACRATLKLETTIDEIKHDVDSVKERNDIAESGNSIANGYSERDYHKDLGYVGAKGVLKLGRLYAPSLIVGSISVIALTGSHVQLSRRNAALSTTLALLTKQFEQYRGRVQKELGEERELELYRCMEDVEYEDEKGKKQVAKVVNPNGLSIYARCFDQTSKEWQKSAELNHIFLQAQQNYFNHRLTAYGHVFLNEIYDNLGFERSQAGQVVGWVKNGDGDDYIDFGLFEARNRLFINNLEPCVWLDFNVDGVVYDKI